MNISSLARVLNDNDEVRPGLGKMEARCNREDLIAKGPTDRSISNSCVAHGAVKFLRRITATLTTPSFFYLDVPYIQQGQSLYENHYVENDHAEIASFLRGELVHPWVVSYDQCRTVTRLYAGLSGSVTVSTTALITTIDLAARLSCSDRVWSRRSTVAHPRLAFWRATRLCSRISPYCVKTAQGSRNDTLDEVRSHSFESISVTPRTT